MAFNATRPKTQLKTKEGGKAYKNTPEMELYLLMASSMMSGDTFYEKQNDRLTRFRGLVAGVANKPNGPEIIAAMAKWGREKLYLRTMPTILAAESFLLYLRTAHPAASWAWTRGDEHLEALAYLDTVGAKRPKQFLQAVAWAIVRLNEYKAIKYARKTRSYSQSDAVALSHPVPGNDAQSALFKYIRHGWEKLTGEEKCLLPEIAKQKSGKATTWEQMISGEGSTPENWEKAAELMGYMALLRNLRNLVESGVSRIRLEHVANIIADRESAIKSKQMPYRYYAALKALPDRAPPFLRDALATAMDISADALPRLSGETALVVDLSPSMDARLSAKSEVTRIEAVAPLAGALARQGGVETWVFSGEGRYTGAPGWSPVEQVNPEGGCARVEIPKGTPVLASMQLIARAPIQRNGTFTEACLRRALVRSFDRVVVLTDGQSHDNPGPFMTQYLDQHPGCMAYVVDVSGEIAQPFHSQHPRLFQVGGFSDHVLDWIGAMEDTNPIERMLEYAGYKSRDAEAAEVLG